MLPSEPNQSYLRWDPDAMLRSLFICCAVLLLAACKNEPVTLEFSGETMGTTYNITAIDPDGGLDADAVSAALEETLAAVNATMSN